jgi:hypothetical protein
LLQKTLVCLSSNAPQTIVFHREGICANKIFIGKNVIDIEKKEHVTGETRKLRTNGGNLNKSLKLRNILAKSNLIPNNATG